MIDTILCEGVKMMRNNQLEQANTLHESVLHIRADVVQALYALTVGQITHMKTVGVGVSGASRDYVKGTKKLISDVIALRPDHPIGYWLQAQVLELTSNSASSSSSLYGAESRQGSTGNKADVGILASLNTAIANCLLGSNIDFCSDTNIDRTAPTYLHVRIQETVDQYHSVHPNTLLIIMYNSRSQLYNRNGRLEESLQDLLSIHQSLVSDCTNGSENCVTEEFYSKLLDVHSSLGNYDDALLTCT